MNNYLTITSAVCVFHENHDLSSLQYIFFYILFLFQQIISRKCGCGIQDEPPQSEEDHADTFTSFIKPYTPNDVITQKDKVEKKGKGSIAERIEEAFKVKDRINEVEKEKDISKDTDLDLNVAEDKDDFTGKDKDILHLKGKQVSNVVENGYFDEIGSKSTDLNTDDDYITLVDKTADLNINNEIQNSETGEIEVKIEQKIEQIQELNEKQPESDSKIELQNSNSKVENPDSENKNPVLPVSELNREEILSKVYCNKCYNVKINGVCLCVNVTLYYTLLAKSNNKIVKSDSKKSVSDDGVASVDLSTAIALINR